MKAWTLAHYRCPLTRSRLSLVPIEEVTLDVPAEVRLALTDAGMPDCERVADVRAGVLISEKGFWYPVINHVPVLLDFDNAAYDRFETQYRAYASKWGGLKRPTRSARPGEELTQRAFTREWNELAEDDELTFTYTHDERRRLIAMEIGAGSRTLDPAYLSLDIGCGSGRESEHLAAVTQRHVFGVDLNVSVIRMGPAVSANPLAHNAVASVFALPFAERSFDLVYSHGVLHHTFNTKRAFVAAESRRKPDGRIYVWLYALEDAQRGKRSRARLHSAEMALRPRVARLPPRMQDAVVSALAWNHYRRYRKRGLKRDTWKLRHSRHSMRDRWTPPFAHRHSFHEVIGWFTELGLQYELLEPVAFRREFQRNLFGIAIRGASGGRDEGAEGLARRSPSGR